MMTCSFDLIGLLARKWDQFVDLTFISQYQGFPNKMMSSKSSFSCTHLQKVVFFTLQNAQLLRNFSDQRIRLRGLRIKVSLQQMVLTFGFGLSEMCLYLYADSVLSLFCFFCFFLFFNKRSIKLVHLYFPYNSRHPLHREKKNT